MIQSLGGSRGLTFINCISGANNHRNRWSCRAPGGKTGACKTTSEEGQDGNQCRCDELCVLYGDCCRDMYDVCPEVSTTDGQFL